MANTKLKPTLFATLGFPGSGKTFFSRRFAKEFKIFHLNSDVLRLEIFPKPTYKHQEHMIVVGVMDFLADQLLQQGISVIYDANATKRVYRQRMQKLARKRNSNYLLLWFKTPTELALKRIKKRSKLKSDLMKRYHRTIDDWVLFKFKKEEEPPTKEPHIVLEAAPYREQRERLLNLLPNKFKNRS